MLAAATMLPLSCLPLLLVLHLLLLLPLLLLLQLLLLLPLLRMSITSNATAFPLLLPPLDMRWLRHAPFLQQTRCLRRLATLTRLTQ